ncbi:MAG: domain containing protein [Myxococcaceae bacterium]|nr:domain containing protein [Myxococcaceae bacterium]
MNPDPAKEEEPSVVGVRVRPKLAIALFALLVISAATALWTQSNPGVAPVWVERSAPWVFLAFVLGFAAYRFALVTAHRYSAFKAFFQIFVAVLFFLLLLLPGSPFVKQPSDSTAPLVALLHDSDPRVRALAAEVAGYRRETAAAPVLVSLLADPEPGVRAQAHAALVRLNEGGDLGTAIPAWKERFP